VSIARSEQISLYVALYVHILYVSSSRDWISVVIKIQFVRCGIFFKNIPRKRRRAGQAEILDD
jgi:hypothetical protein